MLGRMISKIRKDKQITKVSLAKKTGINIGHLTHIEKGERNPTHKTLRIITKALDIPYRMISYLYEQPYTFDHERCKMENHLSCTKVLAVDSYSDFIDCPSAVSNASIAIKINDDSMEPKLEKGSYAFVELNAPLNNRNIGLFKYNGKLIIRRFIIRQNDLVLRAENKTYEEIRLSENDDFTIIGKIVAYNK